MILGFIFFDPNSDMWAFLGGLLALIGFIIGELKPAMGAVKVVLTS
jgi:hypothetical protein